RHARPRGGRDSESTAERGTESGPDGGDFVLGLGGAHAETLVLGQLVQDVRGGRDGVGAQEQWQAGALRGGDQAVGQRQVSGDVAVGAGRQRSGLHFVGDREVLGRLTVVPASA